MPAGSPVVIPRILIAALRGGSGKTLVSVGITAALTKRGISVAPFKKGPDYIDAGWLAIAAGRPCRHLDPFLYDTSLIPFSLLFGSIGADIVVVEGNRGLFDGMDSSGSTSSAEVANRISTPVILCVDCTKSTRTVAALVLGCKEFDPGVSIRGVILNRVAGDRHRRVITDSIEKYTGIRVIGAIPRMKQDPFPERHMGLIPTPEHDRVSSSISMAAEIVQRYVDIDAVMSIAGSAEPLEVQADNSPDFFKFHHSIMRDEPAGFPENKDAADSRSIDSIRIGVARDEAFQFYYEENIEALIRAGAEIVFVSPMHDAALCDIDGLYLGGGFPETQAEILASNTGFAQSIKAAAKAGMPIYAECGGLVYLARELILERSYPMAGVLPLSFGFSKKPQGHGYTVIEVTRENPFFSVGSCIHGHEFHYSSLNERHDSGPLFAFRMLRGKGISGGFDGICYKNLLATYTHIHALGNPGWAEAFVSAARRWRQQNCGA